MRETYIIHIKGLVQGVGFRPFVYRKAKEMGIRGYVENRNDGVLIRAQSGSNHVLKFIEAIKQQAPEASLIRDLTYEIIQDNEYQDFIIRKSENLSSEITEVSPDIAVCPECLDDLISQPHRIIYPLINCTNCGPRFSIIRDLPYDRDKTTMAPFEMCNTCQKEYTDIMDRRFHAQPVACNHCGPSYYMMEGEHQINGTDLILGKTASMIDEGCIIVMKGTGGFQILADAHNELSVNRLRKLKNRDSKPFAVMFRNIDSLKKHCAINEEEEETLLSWRRPIVILKGGEKLAHSVSNGLDTTGCLLPYMPFHHLLFSRLKTDAVVFTSGNISDEPILIKDSDARKHLLPLTDAMVSYNREIYNRVDDSVVFVANRTARMIRRSRGYAPAPVHLNMEVNGIIACGAEFSGCFCTGKGKLALLSQHIGDVKNLETYEFFRESLANFKRLFRINPKLMACDMHPDYLTTRFAYESGLEVIEVQHHHAHIASCMAEHGLDEKVIGIAFDGTGYGDDGNIWGGEFFINDLSGYERRFHLPYIALPGGDKVTDEPWRTAVSVLYSFMGNSMMDSGLPFLSLIDPVKLGHLLEALEKGIRFPLSSGAGRVFDAVAAMTGFCLHSGFHAEAPVRFESVIKSDIDDLYPFGFHDESIVLDEMYLNIITDIKAGMETGIISAKLHNTMANIIFAVSKLLSDETGIKKAVLSGGVFQNRYLLEKSENLLQSAGFQVYSHHDIPSNDGGIALGQLVVAAKKRNKLCV